jgi:hypothetical protein
MERRSLALLDALDDAVAFLIRNPSRPAQFAGTFRMPAGNGKKIIARHSGMTGR